MSKDDVFEYGDQTTFRLRDQEFTVDEYGTVVNVPTPELPAADETRMMPPPASPFADTQETPAGQTMTVDEKLDAILHSLEALQRRVDSLDAMLARVLTR